jgi:hypothetical protein
LQLALLCIDPKDGRSMGRDASGKVPPTCIDFSGKCNWFAIGRFNQTLVGPHFHTYDVLYIAMYCKQWDLFFDDGLPDKTPTNGMLAVDQ